MVIGVVPRTVERYPVDQPLFLRLIITCCNPSSSIDLVDDVFVTYYINNCCTPHLCDKYLLPIIPSPSNINLAHVDINWAVFDAAYLNF